MGWSDAARAAAANTKRAHSKGKVFKGTPTVQRARAQRYAALANAKVRAKKGLQMAYGSLGAPPRARVSYVRHLAGGKK